jgi:putative restriction endonuclease
MPKSPSVKWTREHLLIALNLYCKLPFGQLHRHNHIIIEVAAKMGRTASSLSMKLCNFAALDPIQKARGIRGLSGATKQDQAIWSEFKENISVLGPTSEQLLHDLLIQDQSKEVDLLESNKIQIKSSFQTERSDRPTESKVTVNARRGQQFFRQAVLSAYGIHCCISGISVPDLLVASHIKPWNDFPADRLNPRNGLCLSRLHDGAFDAGLITLDGEFNVILSKRLKKYFPEPLLEQNFRPFENKPISMPEKLVEPNPEFIRYHREEIFEH